MSTLPVFFERHLVGTITPTIHGAEFSYDARWLSTAGAFPVSLSIPLSEDTVPPEVFLPWISNLLPESHTLQSVGRLLGTATSDVIGILQAIGRDTAGALSIGEPGTPKTAGWTPVRKESDLERIIEELPSKPFLIGQEGVSMSLAGVQSKIGVALDAEGSIYIPTNGAPSTHILKPDSQSLRGGVQNEAFCLALSRLVGLNPVRMRTGRAGERSYLIVARYDRKQQGPDWRRLHQEDFCAALGRPPSAKYENNQSGSKGPKIAEMVSLARAHMDPRETITLLDMVIFNVVACNTDAHAKNYSIILDAKGARIAPVYDVMCADVWPGITPNLAQTIAGKNRGNHIKGRHWQRLARECGLNPPAVLKRVKAIADLCGAKAEEAARIVRAMPAGDHPLLGEAVKSVQKRARTIVVNLAETEANLELKVPETEPVDAGLKP